MPNISPFQIAMGVGVGGALVDVSSSVAFGGGITRSWGKQDEFRDTVPGRFSFTLDNHDGRYTPGNPTSTLATTVTERMPVVFNLGGRLVAGSVLAIELAGTEASWGEVTITCDDMLGNASRRLIPGLLSEAMVLAASPYYYWPFDDAAGATFAVERSGSTGIPQLNGGPGVTFGVSPVPAVQATQVDILSSTQNNALSVSALFPTINYAAGSIGAWGAWVTPMLPATTAYIQIAPAGLSRTIAFGLSAGSFVLGAGDTALLTSSVPATLGVSHYLAISLTRTGTTVVSVTFYVDGVSQGSSVYSDTHGGNQGVISNAAATTSYVSISALVGAGPSEVRVSHLSHTPALLHEELVNVLTESGRLRAIGSVSSDVTLGGLTGDLSPAAIGYGVSAGATVLDALNAVIRSEQGSLYTTTTGTLLAPAQTVTVRARTRPAALADIFIDTFTDSFGVAAVAFDAMTELADVPQFVRDITNMFSTVTVTGNPGTSSVSDATLIPRVGVAITSDSVLNTSSTDLSMWGQDRLIRGKNVNLRVVTISVDAVTAPAATTAKLLALNPGDRIRVTSLDATVLGFSSWDGWLLGVSESHSVRSSLFALSLSPVLADTAVFDTNLFMADGALTLTAGITSVATSMSVATAGPLMETVAVPYTLLIDSEQVTVTACTAVTPQVATITRGVNGTTAAAHTLGATPDVVPSSLFAF